jgi:hypothetical protein
MTKNEVIKVEENYLYDEDPSRLIYESRLMGGNCYILYSFKKNKLDKAAYIFNKNHVNPEGYISDFKKMKNQLEKKYGEPVKHGKKWEDRDFKGKKLNLGEALEEGKVGFYSDFKTAETSVRISLENYKSTIKHGIYYKSRENKNIQESSKIKGSIFNILGYLTLILVVFYPITTVPISTISGLVVRVTGFDFYVIHYTGPTVGAAITWGLLNVLWYFAFSNLIPIGGFALCFLTIMINGRLNWDNLNESAKTMMSAEMTVILFFAIFSMIFSSEVNWI